METERDMSVSSPGGPRPDQTKNPKQAFPSFLFDTTAPSLGGPGPCLPGAVIYTSLVLGDIDQLFSTSYDELLVFSCQVLIRKGLTDSPFHCGCLSVMGFGRIQTGACRRLGLESRAARPNGRLTDMDQMDPPQGSRDSNHGCESDTMACWYAAALGLSCYCRSMYLTLLFRSPSKKEGKRKGRKSQEILSSRFFVHGGYY